MKDIHELAKKYYDNTIIELQNWIKINSIFDENTISDGKPFGQGVANALEYIANLAEKDGFCVDRCDGYCTEISFGEGPLISVYAHCDVVPVSGKWAYGPFEGTIKDGIMYGRGTSDDKGPAIASYNALKLLRDEKMIKGFRVALVIGGNEESGSKCLDYYFNKLKKPYPKYGFTPDGDFPLIYGEKAIATLSGTMQKVLPEILSINAGVVINSVIDKACAKVKIVPEESLIERYCHDNGLNFILNDDELTFIGKAAHGSLPQQGINAGLHLLIFLGQYFNYQELVNIGKGYLDGEGKNLDVFCQSELLHETTYNVGLINYDGRTLTYMVNFRYPENVNAVEVVNKLNKKNVGQVELVNTSDYLLVNPKSKMVQTLMRCYQEETGDYISKPMAIGGGTYAKECKNTLAFGSHFVGREDHIHDCNEKIHISDLTSSIAIYAKAIKALGELAGEEK